MPEQTEGSAFIPESQTLSGVAAENKAAASWPNSPLSKQPFSPRGLDALLGRKAPQKLSGPETKLRAVKWFLACATVAYLATMAVAPNLSGAVFADWMKVTAAVVLSYLGVQYLQRKDGIGPGGEK